MFKSILKNAIAVSAVLFPVVSAQASTAKDPLAAWVNRVNEQIDLNAQPGDRDVAGRAVVAFRRGDDGRAYDVVTRSGSRSVAAAATRTIRRLHNLPPLPAGMPADQQIVMNYLLTSPGDGTDPEQAREQMLAWANKANAMVAARLGVSQVASLDR